MIRKLLIANRGEIAMRIIRTANEMGMYTVALYSKGEENAIWVQAANESIFLPGEKLSEHWLNIDLIIQKALEIEADAIHPGYGFLSENAEFARKTEKAGLVFVGPDAQSINEMGHKLNAAQIARDSKVPVQKIFKGSVKELSALKDQLEYPLLIKAASGGGGKGMQKVFEAKRYISALEQTAREAKAYFGNDEVYVERLLVSARHIEVQIVGDGKGQVIHLGERDCSMQRRHQKVIEEAPAACLTSAQRDKVTQFAVQLGRKMNYRSAGTVEFLLDEKGEFWFLEMNTRIQVEHPVTELVTGLDIVRLQLEIASGLPLSFKQDDITFKGHAIEARLYAEAPENDFLPVAGMVHLLDFPKYEWLRVDSSMHQSGFANPDFDPMLAKIIVHGNNREEAIQKIYKSLEQTKLAGIDNNLQFLSALIQSEAFQINQFHTRYIENDFQYQPNQNTPFQVIAAFLAIETEPGKKSVTAENIGYFRQGNSDWRVIVNSQNLPVRFRKAQNDFTLYNEYNEVTHFRVLSVSSHKITLEIEGQYVKMDYYKFDEQTWIFYKGRTFRTMRLLPASGKKTGMKNNVEQSSLAAPMYGKILQINAAKGGKIKAGDTLMVLEAMKMENHLQATGNAVVKKILVHEGDQVADGQLLIEFE